MPVRRGKESTILTTFMNRFANTFSISWVGLWGEGLSTCYRFMQFPRCAVVAAMKIDSALPGRAQRLPFP